jgi:hypothetical protein
MALHDSTFMPGEYGADCYEINDSGGVSNGRTRSLRQKIPTNPADFAGHGNLSLVHALQMVGLHIIIDTAEFLV